MEGNSVLKFPPPVEDDSQLAALASKEFFHPSRGVRCVCVIRSGGRKNQLLETLLKFESRTAVGEDLVLLERLLDASTLDTNPMIRLAISPANEVDPALVLTLPSVLLHVGIVQLALEQVDTAALEGLPVLGARDLM